MAERLSWDERLARAEALLYEARAIRLPAGGSARGGAVRHKQSLLRHGRWQLGRLLAKRPPASATPAEVQRAVWLAAQLEAEQPALLAGGRNVD